MPHHLTSVPGRRLCWIKLQFKTGLFNSIRKIVLLLETLVYAYEFFQCWHEARAHKKYVNVKKQKR